MSRRRRERKGKGLTTYFQCPTCRKWLLICEFYKDKKTPDGIKSQCKKCHTEGNIKTRNKDNKRKLNREYMRRAKIKSPKKFRERARISSKKRRTTDYKYHARQMVRHAVALGVLVKPKLCELCHKKKKLTGHHEDYYKPLNVKWWCYECHGNK